MNAEDSYHLTLLRLFAWPELTKRQRRRLKRVDPLLYATIRGLAEPRTPTKKAPGSV